MRRVIGWGLPLTTALVYGFLVLVHGLRLEALAGGLKPFDLSPLGYDLAAARSYLIALPPEGVALYLGPIRLLDTAFSVLMGLTLLWWMRPFSGVTGIIGAVAAVAYLVLDLAENAAVAVMLRAGPEGVVASDVTLASALTQAKFAAFVLAAALAAAAFWRRTGPARSGPVKG